MPRNGSDTQSAAIALQAAAGESVLVTPPAGHRVHVVGYHVTLDASGTLKFQSDPLTNEVNTLTVDATGGTYDLTVNGQTAAAVAYNANAAALQAAIVALSNVAPGDIVVTGGPGAAGGLTPYTLTWGGALADTNMTVTTDGASLTGGAGTAVVGTTTGGDGTSTDLTGAMAGVSFVSPPATSALFVTAANERLSITTATGKAAGYVLYYTGP